MEISTVFYQNSPDPELVRDGQYGWDTRFLSVGARYHFSDQLEIIGQTMFGDTEMGPIYGDNETHLIENTFASGFIMGSWRRDEGDILSARIDTFNVRDETGLQSFTDERGWSVTSSWRRPLSDRVEIGAELLYIDHDREIDPIRGNKNSGLQTQWMVRASF